MKFLNRLCSITLALCAVVTSARAMNNVAVDEVLKLNKASLGDEGIVAFIKQKNLDYSLSAEDIIQLKSQGLSAAILTAMISSGPQTAPIQVAPTAPAPTIPAPIVAAAPAPTVVAAPVVQPASSLPGLNPDAGYFYQQLSPYGRWIIAEDNQWCWQPSVAVTGAAWRPYADGGHWVWTDSGWYWTSDYPWGWAPFHYGRWRLHPLHGWLWLPDRVWGPAWVVWRSGHDYCGWAPMPPGAGFDLAGVLVFHGRHVAVDFDFGLDWHHFNFCRVREMGEPHFAIVHRDMERRDAFGRSAVINHYTVSHTVVDGHNELKVINHGVEPAHVGPRQGHPVEPVRIQEMRTPAPNRAHEHLDKDGKTLEVYRPHWNDRH